MNGLLKIHWKRMTRMSNRIMLKFSLLVILIVMLIALSYVVNRHYAVADKDYNNISEIMTKVNSGISIKKNNDNNHYLNVYNACNYGLSESNNGEENSVALQRLINFVPVNSTIYIPSGKYKFSAIGNQSIGSHCIKMRSGIAIIGDGEDTILKPVGESNYGLDMFYFNELLDSNSPIYLENCTFKNFVIDAIDTSTKTYTSAGKGFMFNLYKNCHWENVIVKNTDGTGFGMDCPIDCTIINCVAIGCGKSATVDDTGASGFGIGVGYSNDECITIKNCISINNKRFGFFFEHQGIFNNKKYQATDSKKIYVEKCKADGNYYNFGTICTKNVIFSNCISKNYIANSFYIDDSELS